MNKKKALIVFSITVQQVILVNAQHLSTKPCWRENSYNYGYSALVSVVYVLGRQSDERETSGLEAISTKGLVSVLNKSCCYICHGVRAPAPERRNHCVHKSGQ